MTQTPLDPEAAAARTHCLPDCPGPNDHELAGLAAPHSCTRTMGQLAARSFAGGVLAQTQEATEQRDRARDLAAALEQEVAQLVTLTLDAVGTECAAHAEPDPGCALCTLLAFVSGNQAERDDALAALAALGAE